MNLQDALNGMLDKLEGWLTDLFLLLPNLVVAVLVALAFAVAARVGRRVVRSALDRVSTHRSINGLLATAVGIAVTVIGIFIALGIVGLDKTVTSLLAGVGIIGLALGFAFQDIASNLMSGILLLLRRPFAADDIIETGGQFGTVREVNLRATVIDTPDGKVVYMPNSTVLGSALINHSARGARRVDLAVGVGYGDDLDKARRVAIEAVRGVEARDEDRPVELFYEAFGSSSIDFVVRFWIPYSRHTDYLGARSEAIMRVKQAFEQNGITIPFPIRTLDFGVSGGRSLTEALVAAGRAPSAGRG